MSIIRQDMSVLIANLTCFTLAVNKIVVQLKSYLIFVTIMY